jgi:trypsin-like peptidase
MAQREILAILIASWCGLLPVAAQETQPTHSETAIKHDAFAETVVPITALKIGLATKGTFGTGFCVDPACRFIGTNYHVAKFVNPRKIDGEKIVRQYLGTGPDDEEATLNDGVTETVDFLPVRQPSMKYAQCRDLAIFELRHSLAHHHGIVFSLSELQERQEVDIYAYPRGAINPIRTLMHFQGTFKGQTTRGLLAFDYSLNANRLIRPGASGGIVVDRRTQQIVGILSALDKNHEAIALAVPIQSLVEFVTKVAPYVAQRIFPSTQEISAVAADLYPKYVPPSADELKHRVEEPGPVRALRDKAQGLSDAMRDFIAVQTLAWGKADREPIADAAYEVRVSDGSQRFRSFPNGKKELDEIPFPPIYPVMKPGDEWSELPNMVGRELRLKIRQAPDAIIGKQSIKVFQYWANVEDGVCTWQDVNDFVLFTMTRISTVACYGEVWTDENINILRISEHYELTGRWKDFQGLVTYGWLRRAGKSRLVPLTISTQARCRNKIYWCRGQFMDYQMFSAEVRIVANQPVSNLLKNPQLSGSAPK